MQLQPTQAPLVTEGTTAKAMSTVRQSQDSHEPSIEATKEVFKEMSRIERALKYEKNPLIRNLLDYS